MKKIMYVSFLSITLLFASCKGGGEKKQTEEKAIELVYSSVNDVGDFLAMNIAIKGTDKEVMWFHFLDNLEDTNAISFYDGIEEKVANCPANITENSNIFCLAGGRFEIRLSADSENKEYQNTDKLKEFIKLFDIPAMEKFEGELLDAEGLKQFIPDLEVVE